MTYEDYKLLKLYEKIIDSFNNKKYSDVIRYSKKYFGFNIVEKDKIIKIKFMMARSYRLLEKTDEAMLELNEILKMEYNSHAIIEKFFLCYYLNRYEEALSLLPSIYKEENKTIHNYSFSITELVMKKQLGLSTDYKLGTHADYIKSQIASYDLSKAKEHIMDHLDQDSNISESKFNQIDIDYLIECVKESIKCSKKENTNDVLELYYFAVSKIGYESNLECNYIKVVVCPNTTNIIALYPVIKVDSINIPKYLNCDYEKLFKKEEKVKTLSRIDKFNKKYNK